MDSQRMHLRSTVILSQELLDQLPRVSPEFELELPTGAEARIVANTIIVTSGTIRGYHLKLIAETVTDLGGPASVTAGLVNHTAPRTFNGRAGLPLTVIAARLNGGGGRTVGQRGSKGDKGRDGIEMPPIPQPDPPDEPFPSPGPPFQIGRDGEKGGKGRRGGDGGLVELVLLQPSQATGNWFGEGGLGGEGGDGGKGEKVFGKGNIDGDDGGLGELGDPGNDVPATVAVVALDDWRNAVSAARVLLAWERHRVALALEEFRHDNVTGALQELAEAAKLGGTEFPMLNPFGSHLPKLIREHRTITGVARDQDLVPDITEHSRIHAEHAQALADALPTADPISGEPVARLAILEEHLTSLVNPGGDLTVQENDLRDRAEAALAVINELARRASRTRNRLTAILDPDDGPAADPTITLPNLALAAPAVAAALVGVLGAQAPFVVPAPADGTTIWPASPQEPFPFQPAGDQATLLPLDLDLLVPRAVRNRGETITSAELAALRSNAAGLQRLAEWDRTATGQPGSDGKPVVVNLATVAAELRSAVGDHGVLDLLVELAEVAHVWRLARARVEQLLAARETLELQRAVATAVRDKPTFPSLIGPADLLRAVRCLLDALQWYADRADRASALLTFGLTDPEQLRLNRYPLAPELHGDIAGALPILYSPDWERDLEELSPTSLPVSTFDTIINAVRGRDTAQPYADYLERGNPIVGVSPPAVPKEFRVTDRPDVITRFAETGQLWLDVSQDDVAGVTGTSPHAEARVVGVKVSFEFTQAGPGVDIPVLVTHTGLSVQKDLDGHQHRQTMLPASLEVNVTQKVGAERFYEGETVLNPSDPDQTPIKPINFPVYGRGAAASWLVQRQETLTVLPQLDAILVEVLYECIVPKDTASLRSVTFAGAGLRVGSDAAITVRLTGPAGPGGVPVRFTTSDPEVISVPAAILVPAGEAEATAIAKVLKPTGALPPTLTAATADGVTRRVRPVVPRPTRPLVTSARLTSANGPGHVAAVAILPAATGQPGTLLASFAPPRQEPGTPEPPSLVHARRPDLSPIRQAEVGHQPRGLAVDPTRRRIYVANGGDRSNSVSMLDADTLTTLAERRVGLLVDVAVDSGAGLVYVSMFGAGSIMVLSADDLSVVTEISDNTGPLRRPHGLALVPGPQGDAAIYVARTVRGTENEESAVTQLRRAPNGQHSVVRSLDLGAVGVQPIDVAVDPVHDLVFVAGLGGGGAPPELIVLDHPSMTEHGRVRLLSPGRAVAARPGSGLAYVAGEAGLTIVDGSAQALSTRIPLGGPHLDQGLPLSVAVDPVTGTAYVGTRDQATVFRIDAPTNGSQVFW